MGLLDDLEKRIRVGASDLNGYVLLLLITILLLVVPYSISLFAPPKTVFSQADRHILDSLRATFGHRETGQATLFAFDPNALGVDSLILLGLTPEIANRIDKYRRKGGHFYRRSDLLKIYGLDSAVYLRLHPFVQVKPAERGNVATRDLNRAEHRDIREIAGVDPVLAARIVAYRRKLGGFVHIHQLHEVYGADSGMVATVDDNFYIGEQFIPARININTASESMLQAHPYISDPLVQSIVLYRSLNGPIAGREQLESFQLVDDVLIEKLFPYLEF